MLNLLPLLLLGLLQSLCHLQALLQSLCHLLLLLLLGIQLLLLLLQALGHLLLLLLLRQKLLLLLLLLLCHHQLLLLLLRHHLLLQGWRLRITRRWRRLHRGQRRLREWVILLHDGCAERIILLRSYPATGCRPRSCHLGSAPCNVLSCERSTVLGNL